MPPPSVNLTYRIPKNTSKAVAAQIAAFSSLALDQGELQMLKMAITANAVVDGGTYLERNLTLTPVLPDFIDTFGPSENPAVWGLESLWGNRIANALQTNLLPIV